MGPWVTRRTGLIAFVMLPASLLAAFLGFPDVAAVVGGAGLVALSFILGRVLTERLARENDPGKELALNVILALIVVLGLVGVGLIATAIPDLDRSGLQPDTAPTTGRLFARQA